MIYGYARVSTDEQSTAAQAEELRAAGCEEIVRENASGGDRDRPELRRLVERAGSGDMITVVRIDRLARSLSHLLEVIETLEAKGARFRSLQDPIDTGSPQGKFTLQVLGAAAEFERALIRERTLSGLDEARRAGRVGGNPGLKSGDPEALRRIRIGRENAIFRRLNETAEQWVPEVQRLRPGMPWEDLVRVINGRLPAGSKQWTKERLVRAVNHYVSEGLLDKRVLDRAPRRDADDRKMTIVAAIAADRPGITLAEIADRLERMRETTPRGHRRWSPSSVKMMLDRASRNGLIPEK